MSAQVQVADTETLYPSYDSPLYKVMVNKLPAFVVGRRLVVNRFAKVCGVSRQALYRYLRRNQITSIGVAALVKGSNGLLTETDLSPFLTSIPTDK